VVRIVAVAATVGMFLVLAMGVTVTNTGSGHGCGGTWPLCKGKFVPDYAIGTAIEYSHRLITGIEGLLILALAAGALCYWRSRREIRWLVPLMLVFLVIQSALGAIVALTNEIPELRALHFGISLVAFVTILLTADLVIGGDRYDRLRDRLVPVDFRRLVWGVTIYTYVVVYTGAYVQHRGVQLACGDWPLCHGQLVPNLAGGAGIVFVHRLAALLLTGATVWLFLWARRLRAFRPDLYWGAVAALVGVVLQALEGALLVWSRLSVASEIGHGAVVTLFFGALCYLALRVVPRPREVRAVVKPRPASRANPSTPAPAQ
jgi:cytochrome c oxidase assembly protein subunit 15